MKALSPTDRDWFGFHVFPSFESGRTTKKKFYSRSYSRDGKAWGANSGNSYKDVLKDVERHQQVIRGTPKKGVTHRIYEDTGAGHFGYSVVYEAVTIAHPQVNNGVKQITVLIAKEGA